MPAEKGADKPAVARLVLRIPGVGLASATPQVRGAGRRLASGCPQRWGRTGGQQDDRGFGKADGHCQLLGRHGKQPSATPALRYLLPTYAAEAESGNQILELCYS